MEEKELFRAIREGFRDYRAAYLDNEERILIRVKTRARFLLSVNTEEDRKLHERVQGRIKKDLESIGWNRVPEMENNGESFFQRLSALGLNLTLVYASRDGLQSGWKVFRSRFEKALFSYIYQKCSELPYDGSKKSRAVEVLEEVFSKAWLGLDKFNPYKGTVFTWLCIIAKNRVFSRPGKTEEQTAVHFDSFDMNDDSDDSSGMFDIPDGDQRNPEEIAESEAVSDFVLRALFEKSGYPWQTLVFFLQKMDYKPQDIVKRFSDFSLLELSDTVFREFCAASFRPDSVIEEFRKLFNRRLSCTVKETLLPKDNKSRIVLRDSLEEPVGNVQLSSFLGLNPEKTVSEWSVKVLIRLQSATQEEKVELS